MMDAAAWDLPSSRFNVLVLALGVAGLVFLRWQQVQQRDVERAAEAAAVANAEAGLLRQQQQQQQQQRDPPAPEAPRA